MGLSLNKIKLIYVCDCLVTVWKPEKKLYFYFLFLAGEVETSNYDYLFTNMFLIKLQSYTIVNIEIEVKV